MWSYNLTDPDTAWEALKTDLVKTIKNFLKKTWWWCNDWVSKVVEGKSIACEEHYNYFLNKEFNWNQRSLSITHPTIGPVPLVTADMAYDSVKIMGSGRAAVPAGLISEILIARSEVYESCFWPR